MQPHLDHDKTYRAVLASTPLPPLVVRIVDAPDAALSELLADSPFLTTANGRTSADLAARYVDGGYLLSDLSRSARPVAAAADPSLARARLEQIARWRQIYSLENRSTLIGDGTVRLDIDVRGGAVGRDGDAVLLPYTAEGTPRTFDLTVTNTGSTRLYVALLALGYDHSVTSVYTTGEQLDGGQYKTTAGITAVVRDDAIAQGITRRTDRLLVIASTTQFDPAVLSQGGLRAPTETAPPSTVRGAPTSDLDVLLRTVQNRDYDFGQSSAPITDWTTVRLTTIAERRLPSSTLTGGEATVGPITVNSPAGFRGSARLTSAAAVARDLTAPMVPWMLIELPAGWEPYSFGSDRDAAEPLDVLELELIEGADAVTRAPTP